MKKLLTATLLTLIITHVHAQKTDTAALTRPDTLTAATITAFKPYITSKTDKITLNIAGSPLAAGGTAYDALLRAPGITTNNGISFRGRSVLVLLDGKPTNLSGDDLKTYLDALPAGNISTIEILPNPPARYDAKGETVIDIRTNRSKTLGTRGTVNTGIGAGTYSRYNGGASIQYKTTKLNLYSSYDYQHNTTFYDQQTERTDASFLRTDSRDIRTRNNHAIQLGLDYNTTFGFLIKAMDNSRDRNVLFTSNRQDTLTTTGRARFFTPAINVYYRKKLDSAGSELSLNADYFGYDKRWSDDFATTTTLLRDNSPANNTIRSLTADLTHPGKRISWQAGLKTTFTRTDNDVQWLQADENGWHTDTGKTNHFLYKEDIYAAYTSGNTTIRKFSLNLGFRLEHTRTSGHSITTGQLNQNQYTQLFPDLSVTYNASEKAQWGLSYRKSVLRPNFDVLNPFIIYQSQYAYSQGNPYVRSSLTHRYELSYSHDNEWLGSLSYARFVHPIASSVHYLDSSVLISTTDNLTGANMIGLDVTWSKRLLNGRLTTSTTIGGNYLQFFSVKDHSLDKKMLSVYISNNNQFTLAKGLKGELNGYWYSPQTDGAFRYRSVFTMSAGLSKGILQDKATLALNISDIFNSSKYRYSTNSGAIAASYTDHPESRFVKLVFTYRFGNKNIKANRTRTTGIDEIRSRMGN